MKVSLAIPTYNSAQNLKNLLEQVLNQGFDAVYVLDDASSDGTVSLVSKYPVELIRGESNLGPGGNRNRVLKRVNDGIITFLDADMELRGDQIAKRVKEIFSVEPVDLVGHVVLNKQGEPMAWNYGLEMHPVEEAMAHAWRLMIEGAGGDEALIKIMEKFDRMRSLSWALRTSQQIEQVDWVAEGYFSVKAHIFQKLGGFDEKMRYHEAQDLGHRLRSLGGKVIHAPGIEARHLEAEVRPNKHADFVDAQFYFYQKHYGMSREVYDWLYRSRRQKY